MYQRTIFSAGRRAYLYSHQSQSLCACKTYRSRLIPRRSIATLPNLPLFHALTNHDPASLAVVNNYAQITRFTYGNLVADVLLAKDRLARLAGERRDGLQGKRVAFIALNSYDYAVMLLSILASDAIAVPLATSFPVSELKYVMDDSQSEVFIANPKWLLKVEALLKSGLDKSVAFDTWARIEKGAPHVESVELSGLDGGHGGLMLYTSGTTNRPKGVLIPQSALAAQAASLIQAWKYTPEDRLLHLLPLHHIHGIVNALVTPLFAGSSIEFLSPFRPHKVWERLAAPFLPGGQTDEKITFLNAVPTMYNRLLDNLPSLDKKVQDAARTAVSPEHLRLNISGSAALPTPTKQEWRELSHGNVLLERYGMTEVGMALSCGLDFADRVDGSVGWPLPSVEVRLVDTDTNEVIKEGEELDAVGRPRVGEIQLRGPTIFSKYWNNEVATQESFVDGDDGKGQWFKTGDVAMREVVNTSGKGTSGEWAKGPMYFIQGRQSVDIIKVGGEKVSALEVERELLSLPQIKEAAVVGLHSGSLGQKVIAIVVLNTDVAAETGRKNAPWNVRDMRKALRKKLAEHKLPQVMEVLPNELPRNAMGKVNKKSLVREVFDV
ncbi:hypothetical protein BJY00DRAFT_210605 [Aspergillus carlsbadensis]|nr:hypothetical protein BJY00DRAFT_210605 [Aspergillus carlsbadensis]